MVEFLTFMGLWPWPWIGWYYIPSCIIHRPLPTPCFKKTSTHIIGYKL